MTTTPATQPQFVRLDLVEPGTEYWQVNGAWSFDKSNFRITTARKIKVERVTPARAIFDIRFDRSGEPFAIRHDIRKHGDFRVCRLEDPAVLSFFAYEARKAEEKARYEQSDEFKALQLKDKIAQFLDHDKRLSYADLQEVAVKLKPFGFKGE